MCRHKKLQQTTNVTVKNENFNDLIRFSYFGADNRLSIVDT